MLRLAADHTGTLWDALLPEEVRLLPEDLARADALLADPALLAPFEAHWRRHAPRGLVDGRPTIPMATYLRMMLLKVRGGWGYETLRQEVSDSLHLRRFCLIPLGARVPAESTVRKLTRRLGAEVVDELIRGVIRIAVRERRFRARAMRADSTVAAADIRYPTDAGLCADAVRAIARAARRVRSALPKVRVRVKDRSRAVQKRIRSLGRTLRRRTEEAKSSVRRLTEEAATHVRASVREARRLVERARRARHRAAGVSQQAAAKAIARLEQTIALAERITTQVRQRFAGEKIPDRLVSLADPDARPVRRGKLAQPTEFGYVAQIAEVSASTKRGAVALVLPPKVQAGSTHENTLLPETIAELTALGLAPREASFDAGFAPGPTTETMAPTGAELFISGRKDNPGSVRTRRRRARYRVGCEGRIAHLKREYSAGRARLRGIDGARIWESWAALAYDVDTTATLDTG